SQKFGLPPCTKANGCFRKVDQKGGKNWPSRNKLWSMEVALDVEWVHTIAPGAKILLVQANSDRLSDMVKAHDYATRKAGYVSNSWGLPEFSGQSRHNDHFAKAGVSIFVASGDDGAAAGPSYPATAPGVIAVGGTRLTGIGTASLAETGWSGSGGGCSRFEAAHPAQAAFPGYGALNCAGKRAAPDVALVADPRSGVSVYNSYKTDLPWTTLGGTSASTPMWAARAAASGLVVDAALLYRTPPAVPLRDITAGS